MDKNTDNITDKNTDKSTQNSIPTSKVARATQFLKTGVKVGGNYLKHYAKKALNPDLTKDQLHADNAEDIYEGLSQLKGSALKVAQMMFCQKLIQKNLQWRNILRLLSPIRLW